MHRWLSTDNGDQCYGCGIVLDYGATREDTGTIDWEDPRTAIEHDAAHMLAPWCHAPGDDRAHHYVLEAVPIEPAAPAGDLYRLACAYGDATIGPDTVWDTLSAACCGA